MNNKTSTLKATHKNYRHVFFDLDHTLWDFDANAKESLLEVYDHFDLPSMTAIAFTNFYSIYLRHNSILWDRYHKGFITSEDLKWKRMCRTLLECSIGDELLAKNMGAKFLEILPTKKLLFDYTIEILEYLQQKKYSIHLITNGFEKTQLSKLNNSNLAKYFAHVITSEGSNAVKPAKEIFEFAILKAEANQNESIMIGDNPEADIQGAINAGIDSVFVNHTKIEIALEPTYTIFNLRELEEIL